MQDVLDAMFERIVDSGDYVIRQGDDGDNFYVIDRYQSILLWNIIAFVIWRLSRTRASFIALNSLVKLIEKAEAKQYDNPIMSEYLPKNLFG